MKALMDGCDGMVSLLRKKNACCLWFSNAVFKSRKRSRSSDLYEIRLQPCHILQDFPSLVGAVCTPDTSDESRCSGFMQRQAVGPDGLITQEKAKGD